MSSVKSTIVKKRNKMNHYREIVWDAFRRINARAGHVVPMRTLRFGAMQQMNPVEQEQFVAEINTMIGEGFITYEDGRTGLGVLRLTESGYAQLYHCKADYQIAEGLMDLFRRSNYKVGEIIPMRNINMQFIPSLNPVEQDRFEHVVNKLIEAGLITYEDGITKPIPGLVLQQPGYDYIYKGSVDIRSLF